MPQLRTLAQAAAASLAAVSTSLGGRLDPDAAGLSLAVRLIELAGAAPDDSLHLRSEGLFRDQAAPVLDELGRRVDAHAASIAALEGVLRLPLPETLDPARLRAEAAALAGAGLLERLGVGAPVRQACRCFRDLAEPRDHADPA